MFKIRDILGIKKGINKKGKTADYHIRFYTHRYFIKKAISDGILNHRDDYKVSYSYSSLRVKKILKKVIFDIYCAIDNQKLIYRYTHSPLNVGEYHNLVKKIENDKFFLRRSFPDFSPTF